MFNEDYQREVLALSTNVLFMEKHSSLIVPEMFDTGYDELAREIKRHWDKSKKPLSWGQLKQLATRAGVSIGKGDLAASRSEGIDTEELTNFARWRVIRDTLANIHVEAQNFKWEKVGGIWEKMWRSLPGGSDRASDCLSDFGDTPQRENLIPTGLVSLDKILKGGVAAGNLATVLAPTGGGKSTFLIYLTGTALLQGKSVYYVTLEASKHEIEAKIRGRLTGVENPSKAQWKKTLKGLGDVKCLVAEYSSGEVSPADLGRVLPPDIDLLVVDYADDLRGPTGDVGLSYENLGSIYVGLKDLSKEKKISTWTASQVNRSGYDGNITLMATEGSMKKCHKSDQILMLQQTSSEKIVDRESGLCQGSIVVGKNRHGESSGDVPVTIHWATSSFREGQFG